MTIPFALGMALPTNPRTDGSPGAVRGIGAASSSSDLGHVIRITSIDIHRCICYDTGMSVSLHLPVLPDRHKNEPCCAPVAEPSLTVEQAERVAHRLKAVADPTRLRMLDLLVQQSEPICVCDITAQFPQNQPTISHHLRLLREAGLIETEKRGIWSYYWATEEGQDTLIAVTF
ncbi:MAG TPA: metalloregulator ArsR/SmtB family transcription factor [Chloroflexota bacterium]